MSAAIDYAQVIPRAIDTGIRSTSRAEWLNARLTGFTSSDTAALLGYDDGEHARSPFAIYAEKLGKPIKEPDAQTLEIFEVGNELEAPVLKMYGRRVGHEVVQSGALLRHADYPFLLQTVDGIDVTAGEQVEVKTYAIYASKKWQGDQIPPRVVCQVQHQLLFGQARVALVRLPLNERRLRWTFEEPHPEFQRLMLEQLAEHWDRLQRGYLPEVDGLESTREALDALYSEADGSSVELDADEWPTLTDEYETLNAIEKKAGDRKDEIKNRLRAAMGTAAYARVGDGRKWSLLKSQGQSRTCSACGNVDRGAPFRSPRLSGRKGAP